MTLTELRTILTLHPEAQPRFTLPDGDQIPAHFHVTEVAYVAKKFIDCGGLTGQSETCVLQTWLGDDLEHRLTAGRLAQILKLGARVLPERDLEVEVEYDCCVVAQYPIAEVTRAGDHIELALGSKRTQCLARDRRLADANCCGEPAACC
ncbi:MAG: DUF6428 family protein [Verrucomicrobiota bacterium]|nr:DUF6428 family protein [Verrucomicrobiota bacterium]